jgi:endonuclease YncB( thermonuclease family)
VIPRLLFAFILATSISGQAAGSEILTGVASVIDGDTLDIHGNRIRLHGIDAPESAQLCLDSDQKPWRCGQQAALVLAERIGRAVVRCEKRDVDRYQRIVAVCSLGNTDLNGWMVRHGWAVAYRRYSLDYVEAENAAQQARAGIWIGRFIDPASWRRGERLKVEGAAHARRCQIKGNISRNGQRIYHVPGDEYYEATRIDESKGERWFCSEDEALKTGWRKSAR